MISYLSEPGNKLIQSAGERDELLIQSLQSAMMGLENYFGSDTSHWRYGQEKMKHVLIRHPLSFDEKKSKLLNIGPVPRGGNGNTVNSTGDNLNQVFGASFRLIIDCADWDQAKAINTPGQSGDPYNKHYRDLFPLWVENNYFPLYFSETKVKNAGEAVLKLFPE
jgi:penicillin amidase